MVERSTRDQTHPCMVASLSMSYPNLPILFLVGRIRYGSPICSCNLKCILGVTYPLYPPDFSRHMQIYCLGHCREAGICNLFLLSSLAAIGHNTNEKHRWGTTGKRCPAIRNIVLPSHALFHQSPVLCKFLSTVVFQGGSATQGLVLALSPEKKMMS